MSCALPLLALLFTPTLEVRPPRGLQTGEVGEVEVLYRNPGRTPLALSFGTTCGSGDVETVLLDGEPAGPASVTMCAGPDEPVVRTLPPGGRLRSRVDVLPAIDGRRRLQVRYRVTEAPPGVFLGEVVSAPIEVTVAPPDPPGPVVELRVPKRLRAGRPFPVTIRHVNRGTRGWILFNEACDGPPRDFVVVDGEARPVPTRGPCRPAWKDRMTLEPGRHFDTRIELVLPAGLHRLQARYRVGEGYEAAVVWKGEAVSPEIEVEVLP
jgi:hypothetical protein